MYVGTFGGLGRRASVEEDNLYTCVIPKQTQKRSGNVAELRSGVSNYL